MKAIISTLTLVLAIACLGTAQAAELELHAKLRPLPFNFLGPFTHISNGRILAIDSKATFVTSDRGVTWSEPRSLFPADTKITVSNERALLRTKDGTLVTAFMNLDERHWTWSNDLHDAPTQCCRLM